MGKFKLAFGIHNHQPVGNFTAVFEEAYQRAYVPFLELMSRYEGVNISLHQSGILWDWQKSVHPEFFELIGRLVDEGRVELMTGGFFEPILTSVPKRDARGQIEMLNGFLHDHFGVSAKGLWLTERIWEPHLPKLLAEAGVGYLPIDDTHFIYAGFERRQLTGPFVTEDEGHVVTLLPIQKRLRYLIPFGTVEEVIAELRSQADQNPSGMAVYADDGEKFGVWPNTHKHCYEDGWLKDFFEAVSENADWLEIVPLGRAARKQAVGRAYLPSASYEEMLHWSLPAEAYAEYEVFEKWLEDSGQKEAYGRFVRGGHWRGFLAKYDESNLMHKKMLWVSNELKAFEDAHPEQIEKVGEARERLYASQCNCPYWHGVFGGLYLPHIRQAVYSNMIEAHRSLRSLSGALPVEFSVEDYDRDGREEIVCDSEDYTAVFQPHRGGILLDLSLNRHAFNLTDTLSRRKEGYHARLDRAVASDNNEASSSIHDLVLAKEDGLKDVLVEDWYLKRCFIDHFLAPDVDFQSFQSGLFREDGDFVLEPYRYDIHRNGNRLVFRRDGSVRRPDGAWPVSLIKEFTFVPGTETIEVAYLMSSSYPGGADVVFAVENNFSFQAGHAEDRFILTDSKPDVRLFLDSVDESRGAQAIALIDQYRSLGVGLRSDRPADIWHLPILTVSLSEGGFEKVYQGTTIVHRFQLHLTDHPLRIRFSLDAGDMNPVLAHLAAAAAVSG